MGGGEDIGNSAFHGGYLNVLLQCCAEEPALPRLDLFPHNSRRTRRIPRNSRIFPANVDCLSALFTCRMPVSY